MTLQIEHASKCSHEAKLVKLADKLYNLRDLEVGVVGTEDLQINHHLLRLSFASLSCLTEEHSRRLGEDKGG